MDLKCLLFVSYSLLLILSTKHALKITASKIGSNNHHIKCIASEREALLKLKSSLRSSYTGLLKSWGREGYENDCCKWRGVECSNTTGHVTRLDLSWSYKGCRIDASLVELQHLSYLNLSNNYHSECQIPEFIGHLSKLKELDLSYSGFGGSIPHQLGNLSQLKFLNLSLNDFDWAPIPGFIGHLSKLEVLDLSYSNFEGSIPNQLGNLSQLKFLDLSKNNFNSTSIPGFIGQLGKLEELDLSHSNFGKSIPHQLGNLSRLKFLDLSKNNFSWTPIPESFHLLKNLIHLSIIDSYIGGKIQDQLRNMSKLQSLDLADNEMAYVDRLGWVYHLYSLQYLRLDGLNLSKAFDWGQSLMNLPRITELHLSYTYPPVLDGAPPFMTPENASSSLSIVDLSTNRFTSSSIFTWLLSFNSSLSKIDLSYNFLRGPIPNDFLNLPFLLYLDLSHNHLNDNLSNNIGQLHKLSYLDLSSNSFHGIISEDHFTNFTNMKHLFLSTNSLTLTLNPYWIPPCQLYSIGLSSCNIGPPFPRWLQTQRNLYFLDLSSNQLSGIVPNWFWNLSSKASFLNISHNKIYGKVPRETFSQNSSAVVDLSFNYFEGRLPLFNKHIGYVDLSENKFTGTLSSLCNLSALRILDLSNNNLSGELPQCWKEKSPDLALLSLSNNNLMGNLHNLPCSLPFPSFTVLQLRNNSFIGPLPSSLSNCTSLRVLDVASNMISGSIPEWIGNNLWDLRVLILQSNKFSGSIPPNLCLLQQIQVMDLSRNNLRGGLLNCLHNSTALTGRTYRGFSPLFGVAVLGVPIYPTNVTNDEVLFTPQAYFLQFSELIMWKGREYEYKKNLEDMSMVDFSSNKLQGGIPEEFGKLIGLVQLNLSNNNLTGCILHKIGEMRKLEVLDLSSNHLSGEIPQSICELNFLNYLNLSNNNLAGRIPIGTQIQTQSAASFSGNPELCGDPLPKKCHEKEEAEAPSPTNMGDHKDMDGFYISLSAGFVIAFWGVLGYQLFHNFSLLNKAFDWVYMRSALIIAKMQRR